MNRRELLAGCGGAFFMGVKGTAEERTTSLPSLDKNIVLISSNYGFVADKLIPRGSELESEYLQFLTTYKDRMTLLKRIEQREMGAGHGSHQSVFTALSREYATSGPRVSLDQLIADESRQSTRLKSLTIGTGDTHISWSINGQKIPILNDVNRIYSRVFREPTNVTDLQAKIDRLKYQLRNQNSTVYQRSIEQLIGQYENELFWAGKPLPKTNLEISKTKSMFADLPTYFDLITEIIRKDQCKIFTMNVGMQAGGAGPGLRDRYPYSLLTNLTTDYHSLTHNQGKEGYFDQLVNLERFQFDSFKRFIDSLNRHELLDDTIVVLVGGFSDSGSHSTRDLPILVVGGGLNHQKIIDCKDSDGKQIYKMSDFYVTLMNMLGVHQHSFAGYRGNMNKAFDVEV